MGQQWLVAARAVISACGVERRKLVANGRSAYLIEAAASAPQQKLVFGAS